MAFEHSSFYNIASEFKQLNARLNKLGKKFLAVVPKLEIT
jgi:hypothetical protein